MGGGTSKSIKFTFPCTLLHTLRYVWTWGITHQQDQASLCCQLIEEVLQSKRTGTLQGWKKVVLVVVNLVIIQSDCWVCDAKERWPNKAIWCGRAELNVLIRAGNNEVGKLRRNTLGVKFRLLGFCPAGTPGLMATACIMLPATYARPEETVQERQVSH